MNYQWLRHKEQQLYILKDVFGIPVATLTSVQYGEYDYWELESDVFEITEPFFDKEESELINDVTNFIINHCKQKLFFWKQCVGDLAILKGAIDVRETD